MTPHWEFYCLFTAAVLLAVLLAGIVGCHAWTRYRQWRAVPKGYFGRVYGAGARPNEWKG